MSALVSSTLIDNRVNVIMACVFIIDSQHQDNNELAISLQCSTDNSPFLKCGCFHISNKHPSNLPQVRPEPLREHFPNRQRVRRTEVQHGGWVGAGLVVGDQIDLPLSLLLLCPQLDAAMAENAEAAEDDQQHPQHPEPCNIIRKWPHT